MGLFFHHPASLAHDTGTHPERAERLRAIEAALENAGWPELERAQPRRADRAEIERVHSAAHVERIERFCASGGGMIDADTIAVEASWEAALRAAGAAAEATERLLAGEAAFAFSAMRPPGHHAESERAMGFCLFNNAAIAAAHARAACGVDRVLILDWDVHHGNGTAEIFAATDRVLYASIHQDPLYPGTGQATDTGTGAGDGYTINLPVPPGADGELFLALVQRIVAPLADELRPGLLIISAGYDAHRDDPLADCGLVDADYASMAAVMRDLGDQLDAPVLVCLEGGYDLDALAGSALATIRALGGREAPPEAAPELAEPARRRLRELWPAALA